MTGKLDSIIQVCTLTGILHSPARVQLILSLEAQSREDQFATAQIVAAEYVGVRLPLQVILLIILCAEPFRSE